MNDPGTGSQLHPASQVSVELDGVTMTSASAIAPQTEESLTAALEAPHAEPGEEPIAAEEEAAPPAEDAAPSEGEHPGAPPAQKKRQTAQERHLEIKARIDSATRELRDVERRTSALREEAERLLRPPQPQQAPPQEEAPAKRPRWKDYEDQGKTYQDFEEDLATWDETRDRRNQAVVEQRLAAQRHQEEAYRAQTNYEKRVAEARTKHPDWDDTIRQNLNDVPQTPFLVAMVQAHPKGAEVFYEMGKSPEVARAWAEYDSARETKPTQPILSALGESANPFAMLEHLATNRDEYLRLTRLSPVSALLALGKLETALTGAKNGSSGRPVSHAAAPLSHRAGSHTSGSPPAPDDMDIEEYVRAENKRLGRKR